MAILKRDLVAVQKDVQALEKKMEKLLNAFEKTTQPTKKVSKAATKGKAKPVKKVQRTKTGSKSGSSQMTATDRILRIIKRSRKGVDVPSLKVKTGFDDKKVRNIVFRAAKEGKIKKVGRGIYMGA